MTSLLTYLRTHQKLNVLPFGWLSGVLVVVVAIMLFPLSQVIPPLFTSDPSSTGTIYLSLGFYLVVIAIAILVLSAIFRSFSGNHLGFVRTKLSVSLGVGFGLAVVFNLIVGIASWLDPSLQSASAEVITSLGFGHSTAKDVATILLVTVFAPLWEEVVFRGMTFRAVRDTLATKVPKIFPSFIGLLVSSFLFIEAHGGGGQDKQLPYLFLLAVLLGLSYLYTGSLLAPMVFHSINNSWVLFKAFNEQNQLIGGMHPAVMLLGPVVVGLVFWAITSLFGFSQKK